MGEVLGEVPLRSFMQEMLAVTAEAGTRYVQSVLFPDMYQSAPPNLYQRANFLQTIAVNGNFTVSDDSHNPEVSSQSGMIQWLPMRGIVSCLRYGFVTAGTLIATNDPTDPARGWDSLIDAMVSAAPTPPTYTFVGNLTFTDEVAIPYGTKNNVSDIITFDPDVQKNFSSGRLVSGIISLSSSTTSTTLAALTGVASFGAIPDSRDVSQRAGGKAYDPAALQSTSVTAKDGVSSSLLAKGVVSIVGPDIAAEFSPPNADGTNPHNAEGVTVFAAQVTSPVFTAGVGIGYLPQRQVWITPLNATLTNTLVTPLTIQTGPIDECGSMDINIATHLTTTTTAAAADWTLEYVVLCEQWYAQCKEGTAGSPFNVYFNRISRTQILSVIYGTGAESPHSTYGNSASFQMSREYHARGGVSQLGKLVGTLITYWVRQIGSSSPATNTVGTTLFFGEEITYSSPTVGVPGWVGPMHALEWRSVTGVGQQISVNGTLVAQVIPNSSISTFTKDAVQRTMRAVDANVICMIPAMFDASDTFVRRNWVGTDYDEFRKSVGMKPLGTQTLISLLGANSNAAASMHAAGLFSGLGDVLGGMLDRKFGLGGIGRSIGSALGGAADSALGARGQFGAVGQFGSYLSAAGSYGSDDPAAAAGLRFVGRRLRDAY